MLLALVTGVSLRLHRAVPVSVLIAVDHTLILLSQTKHFPRHTGSIPDLCEPRIRGLKINRVLQCVPELPGTHNQTIDSTNNEDTQYNDMTLAPAKHIE